MKNSNDTIGNRTRDLPACSAVPQPTAPSRAPYPNLARVKKKPCAVEMGLLVFAAIQKQPFFHFPIIVPMGKVSKYFHSGSIRRDKVMDILWIFQKVPCPTSAKNLVSDVWCVCRVALRTGEHHTSSHIPHFSSCQ